VVAGAQFNFRAFSFPGKSRMTSRNKDQSFLGAAQGCQIFLGKIYQKGENYAKRPQNFK
jgi:hypothetical protein